MSDRPFRSVRVVRAQRRMTWISCLLALAAALLVASGCSRPPRSEIYAVEGILLVDGAPAANASVAFHARQPGLHPFCPVARTDRNGRFQLTSKSPGDGAPPGDYAVTVIWIDETIPFDECQCDNPLIHDRLKGYYADAALTELRATVLPAPNSLQFHTRRPPDSAVPLIAPSSLPGHAQVDVRGT